MEDAQERVDIAVGLGDGPGSRAVLPDVFEVGERARCETVGSRLSRRHDPRACGALRR